MFNADDLKTLLQVAAFGSLIAAIGFVADQCTNPRQQLTITALEDGKLRVGTDDLGPIRAMTPIPHRVKPGMVYVELHTAQGVISSQTLIAKDPKSLQLGRITFKDERDGTTYNASWHGPLLWMSDNLRFNLKGSLPAKYDSPTQLYTWAQAKEACPKGWRLPSHDELKALAASLGGVDDLQGESIGNAQIAGVALNQSPQHHLNFSITGDATLDDHARPIHGSSRGRYWSSTSSDDRNASVLQLRRIASYTTTRGLNEQELRNLDQREKLERPQTLNDRRKQEQRRNARVSMEIGPSIGVTMDALITKTTFNPVKCVRPFKGDKNTLNTH